MKTKVKYIIVCLIICLFACPVYASYTYEVYTYGDNKILHNEETILVDLQGGMDGLTLYDNSFADIKGTSTLEEFFGGIWYLSLSGSSHFNFSGGEVHQITMNSDATAYLTGGLIQQIWSTQIPWKWDDNNQQWIPYRHITIECSDHFYDSDTNLLTGHWLDSGDPFSIYLSDVPEGSGYPPAIDNIQFVPEPATLLLLGLGGLALHRQSERNLLFQNIGGEA